MNIWISDALVAENVVLGIAPVSSIFAWDCTWLKPDLVVSIWGADDKDSVPKWTTDTRVKTFFFDDIVVDSYGYIAPRRKDVEALLAVPLPETGPTLVHCAAGISRSSATIGLYMAREHQPENLSLELRAETADQIVRDLVMLGDTAARKGMKCAGIRPNPRIIMLGDEILGWGGTLFEAFERVWPRDYLDARTRYGFVGSENVDDPDHSQGG